MKANPEAGTGRLSIKERWNALHPIFRSEACFALVGFLVTAALIAMGAPPLMASLMFGLLVLILPIVVFVIGLPILIHELGHYVAARGLGLQVVGFDVLGIRFIRNAPALSGTKEYYGFVQVVTTLEQDRPEVWVPYIAAGPLAGLAGAAVEGVLWWANPTGLGFLFGIQAFFGLTVTLTSLLSRNSSLRGDGEKIQDVRKPDSQVFALTSYRRLIKVFEGMDPRECDPEDLRRAMLLRDPARRVYATAVVCFRESLVGGPGALGAARDYFETAVKALRKKPSDPNLRIVHDDAVLELAFAQAFYERDGAKAEETLAILDRIEPPGFPMALRVEAALALASGEPRRALECIKKARFYVEHLQKENPGPLWELTETFLRMVENVACNEAARLMTA